MLVTRNMTTNGKMPSIVRPDAVEDARLAGEGRQVLPQQVEQAEQHAGQHQHHRDGAVVVPQLAQHAAGGGAR